MAPPVNQPGRPPDVTVHLVFKETGMTHALRGSREMVARNVPLVFKEMNVNDAHTTSTGKTVVMVLFLT